jgi:hypothetical protein
MPLHCRTDEELKTYYDAYKFVTGRVPGFRNRIKDLDESPEVLEGLADLVSHLLSSKPFRFIHRSFLDPWW